VAAETAEKDRVEANERAERAERERATAEREQAQANERTARLEVEVLELRQKLRDQAVNNEE
jgi:hypothetical protein